MKERSANRRTSRNGERARRIRRTRFCCRTRPDGFLTPTTNQLLQTHISAVKQTMKILPFKIMNYILYY